jgi:hypothetical protein
VKRLTLPVHVASSVRWQNGKRLGFSPTIFVSFPRFKLRRPHQQLVFGRCRIHSTTHLPRSCLRPYGVYKGVRSDSQCPNLAPPPPPHTLPFPFFSSSVSLFFVATMPIWHTFVSPSEGSSPCVLDPENIEGVSLRRGSRHLYSEPYSRRTAGTHPTVTFEWRSACAS